MDPAKKRNPPASLTLQPPSCFSTAGWRLFFLMLFACFKEYTSDSYSHSDREHVARGKRRNHARLRKLKFSFPVRELNSPLSIASNCTTGSYTESREFNSRTEKENFSYARRAWFLLFPSETRSRPMDKYDSVVYSSQQSNNIKKKNGRNPEKKTKWRLKRKRTLTAFLLGFELILQNERVLWCSEMIRISFMLLKGM